MGNRKAFTGYVVKEFKAAGNHANSAELAEEWLNSLSDAEFEAFVKRVEDGEDHVTYIIPNDLSNDVELDRWIEQGERIGAPIYSTVVEYDPASGLTFTSNEKHWIAYMPERSQIQHVDDKKSVAEDNNTRDLFTGQVTGSSKGSAISAPQFNAILSRDCIATAVEFAKFRGGDIAGARDFNSALIRDGSVTIEPMLNNASKPTINFSLSSYLNGMHIANDLLKSVVVDK